MRRLYTSARPWIGNRALRAGELLIRATLSQGEAIDSSATRPGIPPVLLCGLFAWASCACLYLAWMDMPPWSDVAVAVVGAAAIAFSLVVALRTKRVFLAAIVLGAAIGVSSASIGAYVMHSFDGSERVGSRAVELIELLEDARQGTFSRYATAYAYAEGDRFKVRVYLDDEGPCPRFGDTFSVQGTIEEGKEQVRESFWRNGLVGTLKPERIEKMERTDPFSLVLSLRGRAIDSIYAAEGDKSAKDILSALVCGCRVGLYESDAYTDFKIAGLAHLVAVSGAHLSLVTAMMGSVLARARLPKRLNAALQIVLIAGFLVFTGLPVSAVRAAVMSVASLLAFRARRRASSLNALGVALLAFIALEPQSAVSASLALSATSVLGILVFGRLFRRWCSDLKRPWQRRLGDSVATTFAATILSAPISACLFNQLPLVSPLANLIAAPLFTAVCLGGVVSCVFAVAFPLVGYGLMTVSLTLCEVMAASIHVVSSLPFASIPFVGNMPVSIIITSAIAVALWAGWPRLSAATALIGIAAIGAGCACMLSVGAASSGLQLVALDVGQGDAILVRDGAATVLVDTGKEDQKLLAALARQGIVHLDAVMLTHPDADHVQSLSALNGVVQVDRVIMCQDALTCGCKNCGGMVQNSLRLVGESQVEGVSVGDEIHCGRATMRVIWPASFADAGGNADSLCVVVDFDADEDGVSDARALLCGDAEDDQLDAMLKQRLIGSIDIYKVGHHGSRNAIDSATAQALAPRVSLVSVGAYNTYGHPAQSTIDALRMAGSQVFRTDEAGDIACLIGSDAVTVVSQSRFAF